MKQTYMLLLVLGACTASDDPVPVAEAVQPVSCNPPVTVYPVRAPHNHGYDSTAGNSSLWTCDAVGSNEDFGGAHIGNDIWAALGAPVAATVDGTATLVGFSSGSGNKVTIADRCGWYHAFFHLDSIAPGIANGVQITAGQIIGTVGKTGTLSNGVVHLHVSIYPAGNYDAGIDPWPYHRAVESNVCGPVTPPVRSIPAFRRKRAVDVDGDRVGDVCARAGDAVYCASLDRGGSMRQVAGPPWSDAAGWNLPQYNLTIQMVDANGDGRADICGRDSYGITCYLADGTGFPTQIRGPAWSDGNGWADPKYYSTIQFPDIDGDGKADVCGRAAAGITCYRSDGAGFPTEAQGPAWSDANGWADPKYYATIQFPDIDGDGKADVCTRHAGGVACNRSDGTGFPTEVAGPPLSDANGWGDAKYYATIQFPDLDGDRKADLCARGAAGVSCWLSSGDAFPTQLVGPAWSDAGGWGDPKYHATIQFADVTGDGKADLCGRAADGIHCVPFDGAQFGDDLAGPAWSDASGWGDEKYYSTIQFADIDSDGKDDVCGRGSARIHCALSSGDGFPTALDGPAWSDGNGWGDPKYFPTIQLLAAPTPRSTDPGEPPGGGGGSGEPPGSDVKTGGCAAAPGGAGALFGLALVLVRRRRRR